MLFFPSTDESKQANIVSTLDTSSVVFGNAFEVFGNGTKIFQKTKMAELQFSNTPAVIALNL